MPGFPDWQKIVQWIGNPLFESTGVAYGSVGQTNLGQQGLAPAFRSVMLVASNATQNVRLDMVWFQTVSDLFGTFMQTVYVRQFQSAAFILPARGHGFSVFGKGGAPGTIDLAAYPTNLETAGVLVGGFPGYQGAGVLSFTNSNIAALGSASFSLPAYFGPADVTINTAASAWQLVIDTTDEVGTFISRSFVTASMTISAVYQRIMLPPGFHTFSIFNQQAAIQNFVGGINAPIDPNVA